MVESFSGTFAGLSGSFPKSCLEQLFCSESTEVVTRRCFVKKMFLKILQSLSEPFFNKVAGQGLAKKRLWHRCFPMDFAKFLRTRFLIEHLQWLLLDCNIRLVFQAKQNISNFFTFKDRIPLFVRSDIVYKFQCGGCYATYYDKTKGHFKVRMFEHLRISAWLCIKPGIQERGTECGERGKWGGILYSGECLQTFCEMLPNILGEYSQTVRENLLKHSGECRQTFQGLSANIPGYVTKHYRECPQWGMSSIPFKP